MMHSIARVEFRQNAARLCVLLAALSGLVSGGCGPGHSAVLPAPRLLAGPVRKSANTRPFEKSFAPGVSKAALAPLVASKPAFPPMSLPNSAMARHAHELGLPGPLPAPSATPPALPMPVPPSAGGIPHLISLKPQAAPGGGGK